MLILWLVVLCRIVIRNVVNEKNLHLSRLSSLDIWMERKIVFLLHNKSLGEWEKVKEESCCFNDFSMFSSRRDPDRNFRHKFPFHDSIEMSFEWI